MTASKWLFFFIICLGLGAIDSTAQKSKTKLEQEKRENLNKIAEAEKILKDTESIKNATLGQLKAINQQIQAREGLITALNQEVGLLNGEITELGFIVNALQRDLVNLRKEYAAMINSSYKANKGYSKLTFLFSSRTFNQLFMRLKYLEQYTKARKIQAAQIESVKDELAQQRNIVTAKRTEQKTLLNQQLNENKKLLGLKDKQSGLVQELTNKQKELKKELADRKLAVERLDNLIADIVRSELERSKTLSSAAIADDGVLTGAFESNKSKLEWPVSSGFVSSKFGKHAHPVIKGVIQDNPGVDIQTSRDEIVKSVYDGKVIQIAYVPGMYNVVILQHGEYYTVYSRLKEVSVKKGTTIKQNEALGKVHTDNNGVSEVHFEVWKNFAKLNPELWLSPK
ncbi:MAG: septal ring factor EnvC (AmiA/AmiB activator) [Marinoscillum sp.]|jgi:septal ring factor EnvC (AmiA/AmiB activator)